MSKSIVGMSCGKSVGTPISSSSSPYEYICYSKTGEKRSLNRGATVDHYVPMIGSKQRLQHSHEDLLESNSISNLTDDVERTPIMRSYNPNRKLRRMPNNYENFCAR